ncbi:MAG: class B sortase [Butyrivibrio sp.]|nr:class B sortase [Butyrivibrio sp.]
MSKRKFPIIALFIVVCGISAGTLGYFYSEYLHNRSEIQNLQEIAYEDSKVSHSIDSVIDDKSNLSNNEKSEDFNKSTNNVEIPVDIKVLQETNPDILAWISIPDTVVDYPIAQHPMDDEYYLKHGPDGMYSSYGCPYIEICDEQPFVEFNTVIYGHNMKDGTMFASLHKYEDKDFFDDHREILIYTADHVYLYEVFAAVMYSDNRIPYYFDDAIVTDRKAFLDSLSTDIVEERSYISEDMDVTEDDSIITLSTCDKKLRDKRFLVVAKLTKIDGQDVEQ